METAVWGPDGRRERRSQNRRCTRLRSMLNGTALRRRRRAGRRRGDADIHYVDWYDQRLFAVVMGIFLLCCLDAFFTLNLLTVGAEEVNPFMAMLLDNGVRTFVHFKLLSTALALVFLVVHAGFRIAGIVRVRFLLHAILAGYVTLFVYQIGMVSQAI